MQVTSLPKPPELRRRARLIRTLAVTLALALPMGCGLFCDRSELKESKRISECRLAAKRACYRLAKEDETLDRDACVSDRAWKCSLGEPVEPEAPKEPDEPKEAQETAP